MRKTALLLLTFCLTLSIKANTYFVSNSGNNLHAGSQQNPWQTLQYACENVNAGDTICVLSGQYTGFYMSNSGTSSSPIVIIANPGATIIQKNTTTDDAINLEGASFVIIDGFTIENSGGSIERAGIRSVVNEGVIIRNNHIDGMGKWGIFSGFSENILVENNLCANSGDEHGIYVSNSADNPVVRYNICYGNNGGGIQLNADESMGDDGIISNALIDGNILYENGLDGGSAINLDGVQNSVIQNNLLYNNIASGISLFQIDGAEGSKNNLVINNTIVMPSNGRWCININTGSTGNKIFNNILFSEHSFRGGLSSDEESLTGLVSDYNIVIDRFSTDWGESTLSLEEWQSETGQDMNSKVSDPQTIFANISQNNYRLKEGCIAIDKGTSALAPHHDIAKNARPFGNGTDIGAYEFGAGPASVINKISAGKIKIYPNPVTDFLTVESEFPITKIEIIDIAGKQIECYETENQNKVVIGIHSSFPGVMFLRVCSNNQLYLEPIIRE